MAETKITPIYGNEISYRPTIDGKQDTPHNRKIYLEQLLPLEDYDTAAYLGRFLRG